MSLDEEVNRLQALLSREELPPDPKAYGLDQFSAESKNELIKRLVRTLDPAPRGRLLARLGLIATDQNKADMEQLFIANLRSPRPQARQISLLGLAEMNYPNITDLAVLSLRDDSDQVLVTACDLLLSKAKQDPRLWQFLKDVYTAHKDDPQFHMTKSFLEAHGVNQ